MRIGPRRRRPALARVACCLVAAGLIGACSSSASTTTDTTAASTTRSTEPVVTEPSPTTSSAPPTTSTAPTTVASPEVDLTALGVPEVTAPAETLAYMEGEGAALEDFLAVVRPAATSTEGAVDECRGLLASLSDGPSPDRLIEIAGEVPDEFLSAAHQTLIASVGRFVTSCVERGTSDPELGERIETTVSWIDARMEEIT